MSSARRSLLTATAAGTLLGALWFVPSANATGDKPVEKSVEQQQRADTSLSTMSDFTRQISTTSTDTSSGTAATTTSDSADSSDSGTGDGTRLADTGSFNTTPYVVGGTLSLGLGAGFVMYSLRRERLGF
ncbi:MULTISPECIES: LPXTG cell wall anchor domain-containing protein [Streptomyces]|uniref:LPXTG cell wall anchor domain-containing protein n=1 Tax=Streptomyces sp. NBC_00093 TaxID=2975649 RepID=A0AAU1ZXZ7_9ACTN